jgi:hypothetical protein
LASYSPFSRWIAPRAGSRIAKPDLAGKFCVRGRHKSRHFLVTNLHVFHGVPSFFQCSVEAADAISRIAINSPQPPFGQPSPNKLADIHRPVDADANGGLSVQPCAAIDV